MRSQDAGAGRARRETPAVLRTTTIISVITSLPGIVRICAVKRSGSSDNDNAITAPPPPGAPWIRAAGSDRDAASTPPMPAASMAGRHEHSTFEPPPLLQ